MSASQKWQHEAPRFRPVQQGSGRGLAVQSLEVWSFSVARRAPNPIGMRPALLIHGPTASGKTELAVEMAKALDGEVINADSMQVYRDMNVLTARHIIAAMPPGWKRRAAFWRRWSGGASGPSLLVERGSIF